MGQFGDTGYTDGKTDYIDFVDVDKLSMLEIKEMVRTAEVEQAMQFFWLMPGVDVHNGLKLLESDKDVLEMGGHVPEDRVIHLYVKHTNSSCGSPDTAHFVHTSSEREVEEIRAPSVSVKRGHGHTFSGGSQGKNSTGSSHKEQPAATNANEEVLDEDVLERDDLYASEGELLEKTGWGSEEEEDVFNINTIFPEFRVERDMQMPDVTPHPKTHGSNHWFARTAENTNGVYVLTHHSTHMQLLFTKHNSR
ncbi:unnamed protein product [Linum trigynum]|uniref:PB1-like domain-containing protein n=1 Tax=Linum trigynum TaxID=586398 RepID=A0AAV2G4D7_9ROSI